LSIKYAVLGLLCHKNLHGYRIREHIEQHFGNLWIINPGQIYPVLHNMEKGGLIVAAGIAQKDEKGPYRKLYAITEAGKTEFLRWLKEFPEKGMEVRDPFLTRFVFFEYGDKERVLELIDGQIVQIQKALDKRQTASERLAGRNIYTKLVAELGISSNVGYLEWLKRARKEIANNTE